MTTWVLVRGWTREARHWGDFPRHLSESFPADPVATPDLPGAGIRWNDRSPASIAGYVGALREDLDAQGARGPYVVVGISMGGMIAIEWARQHPREIASAAVINTSDAGTATPWQRLRPTAYARLARLALVPPGTVERERQVLRLTSNVDDTGDQVARTWARYAEERPMSAANAARQLAAASTFRAPRVAPPVPWLVLCSARDRLVDPACSWRLARRWNVPLREHATGGHELALDDPAWITAQLAAAFRRS